MSALGSPPDGFPVLSQVVARWVPPWYDVSRPDPTLPSLAGKPTVDSCRLSTKRRVHVSWGAGAAGSLGARKSPHFCLECRGRTCANPRWGRLPAFSRPLSRCSPLLYCPPVLCLWCVDETSSAQWTIFVPSLRLQTRRREDTRKGRCACRDHTHPQALLLPGVLLLVVVDNSISQLRTQVGLISSSFECRRGYIILRSRRLDLFSPSSSLLLLFHRASSHVIHAHMRTHGTDGKG